MPGRVVYEQTEFPQKPNWLQSKITDPQVVRPGGIRIKKDEIPPVESGQTRPVIPGGIFLCRNYTDMVAGEGFSLYDDESIVAVDADAKAVVQEVVITLKTTTNYHDGDLIAVVEGNKSNILLFNFLPQYNATDKTWAFDDDHALFLFNFFTMTQGAP